MVICSLLGVKVLLEHFATGYFRCGNNCYHVATGSYNSFSFLYHLLRVCYSSSIFDLPIRYLSLPDWLAKKPWKKISSKRQIRKECLGMSQLRVATLQLLLYNRYVLFLCL